MEKTFAVRLADRSGIVVRGKDRLTWLNGLVTCDLAKLGPGSGAYGLIVEKKGRIQTDLYLVPAKGEDVVALAVPASLREATLATLDHYLVMEDAELEPADLAFFHVHGEGARAVADELDAPFAGALDVLGSGGAALAVPSAESAAFEERLARALAKVSGTILDDDRWNAVRIEHGLPRFGVEVDATLYPQEAALERLAVAFDKGCYLGQEVVYMLENRGHVKRKLVPLDVDGDAPLAAGDAVTTSEGATVGDVKSSVVGPRTGRPVAIAMVKWAQSKPGTVLKIGDREARVRA